MNYSDEAYKLDSDGYRKNVGIIVCNSQTQVLWARRINHDGWQFPQGGIGPEESAKEAAFRELYEEVGLQVKDVELLGSTAGWMYYDVPYAIKSRYFRRSRQFRGQKQRWFLFKLIGLDSSVRLDISESPEFDQWCWVDYWSPIQQIVAFKKGVYSKALTELEPFLSDFRL